MSMPTETSSTPARPELRRTMGVVSAFALVVGIIVGATIFVQPSEVTRLVPTTFGALAAWAAAGALTLCGALVCAELSSVFRETGGVYIFLKRIFSPGIAFLWGWAMFWSMHSGIVAAVAVILARYAAYFFPMSESGIRALGAIVILLLSIVNYLGVKPGSVVQIALTSAKISAILAIAVSLFAWGGAVHRALLPNPAATANAGFSQFPSFGLAVAAGLFAFGGWHMVTYSAGETRNPESTLPRALVAGALAVTACYMLLTAAYQYVLPVSAIAQSSYVAAAATERVLGPRAAGAIAVVVVLSALGSLNGIILAGPRVYYAMARDRLAPAWMAAVHPHRRTPHWAIAAQALWSAALVASNSYRQLFTRVVYTEWVFFALLAWGVIRLRRQPDYQPPFRVPGYPAVPAIFIVAALAIAVNLAAHDVHGSLLGLGLFAAGIVVFLFLRRRLPAHAIMNVHADH